MSRANAAVAVFVGYCMGVSTVLVGTALFGEEALLSVFLVFAFGLLLILAGFAVGMLCKMAQ